MSVKVIRPGLFSTIQDLGRVGYQNQDVVVGGGMDPYALRIVNMLVGNDESAAVLEMTMTGAELQWENDVVIAIYGANMSPEVDGVPIPQGRPVIIPAGTILTFGGAMNGCRTYLAVAGGFAVAEVLGSRSTYTYGGWGGLDGRPLKEGDILPIGELPAQMKRFIPEGDQPLSLSAPSWFALDPSGKAERAVTSLRVIEGPEEDMFTSASLRDFYSQPFSVSNLSDRMGMRLNGPALQFKQELDMLSSPVTVGTVQIPPNGEPIILLVDRQTTGGYARIGTITSVDLARLAQIKPGDAVTFQKITVEQSQHLYIKKEQEMERLKIALTRMYH